MPIPFVPGHHILDPSQPLGEAARVGWLLTVLAERGAHALLVRPLWWEHSDASMAPHWVLTWGIQTTCN